MKLIDEFKMNKVMNDVELMVGKNKRGAPVLYLSSVENPDKKVLLRNFFGEKQYRKFMVRSVILSLLIGDGYKSDIDRCYRKLRDYLYDEVNNDKVM